MTRSISRTSSFDDDSIVSPNADRLVAVAGVLPRGSRVSGWDLTADQPLTAGELPDAVSRLAVGKDNRTTLLLTRGRNPTDQRAVVWDVVTGRELHSAPLRPVSYESDLALSPDGRVFALAGYDAESRGYVVHLYETWGLGLRATLCGHLSNIRALAFSPDGKTLASGSWDTTALLWDLTIPYGRLLPADSTRGGDELWAALGERPTGRAWEAMRELVSRPDVATKLLATKLRPADGPTVDELIGRLGHAGASVRADALRAAQPWAEATLRRILTAGKTAENREWARVLLMGRRPPTHEDVRIMRSVEVLERIGTPTAIALLRDWSKGSDTSLLTHEARMAIHRLK